MGKLKNRGTLLKPHSTMVSLRSFEEDTISRSTSMQEENQDLEETEQAYIPFDDANSLQRVYFAGIQGIDSTTQQALEAHGYGTHKRIPYHCMLPAEYNFFVEYKSATQYLDMIWNTHEVDQPSSSVSEKSFQDEDSYLNEYLPSFRSETLFNSTRDLVTFSQMILPPKVLHWAGENRKPWERLNKLVRSRADELWWEESDAMEKETKEWEKEEEVETDYSESDSEQVV